MERDKSKNYKLRQVLMKSLHVPTLSDAVEHLKGSLAQIVFEQTPQQLRESWGLTPPLNGAGEILWTSPSDLLIGKVCLKPPFTQKCIQALTHQGILEIGKSVELKFFNYMQNEQRKALEDQECMLRRIYANEMRRLLEKVREEERLKYLEQLAELEEFYKQQIKDLVATMTEEMNRMAQEAEAEKERLNAMWEQKLEEEVRRTTTKLVDGFLLQLKEQEELLVTIFKQHIKNLEAKHKCALDLEKIKCKETLTQIKHSMECRNIANLMYILCKERTRCKLEKQKLEESCSNEVQRLKTLLARSKAQVRRLTRLKNYKTHQVKTRERCLVEILKQFQKFINFALRAWPTQAEFLLNIDKMMRFEIDDYCLQNDQPAKTSKLTTVGPTESDHADEIVCTIDVHPESIRSSIESIEPSDALPAIFLNERMYIRQDFRDLLLNNIEISKGHKLWNPDVEELMELFKISIAQQRISTGKSSTDAKSSYSSVKFTQSDIPSVQLHQEDLSPTLSSMSQVPSTTSLNENDNGAPKKSLIMTTDSLILAREHMSLTLAAKSNHRQTSITSDTLKLQPSLCRNNQRPSRLAVARDSVILYIANNELKDLAKPQADNKGEETTSGKSKETTDIPDSNQRSSPSKLALHCDSLEILKTASKVSLISQTKNDSDQDSLGGGSRAVSVSFYGNPQLITEVRTPQRKKHVPPSKCTCKKRPKAKVAGDRKATQHLQTPEQFTNDRINSLVNLIKDDPSLIRMFTSCSKQCS